MSTFVASKEVEKIDIWRGGWVRFLRNWDWHVPSRKGRSTIAFRAGLEIRLTRAQLQSALQAGAVVCIPNPRHANPESPP